jgi:hypothetical protein
MGAKADDVYRLCGGRATGFITAGRYTTCIKGEPAKSNPAKTESATGLGPTQTITERQLELCRSLLKEGLKDPESYFERKAYREEGGLIEYTATNSYGGRLKKIVQCTSDFPFIFNKK